MILVIISLMCVSLLIISANSRSQTLDPIEETFFTSAVKVQMQWFVIGWVAYFLFTFLDYNKLREFTWILYIFMLIFLVGLFFVEPIQGVRRWYRVPFVNHNFQPSEVAKLVVVITLSWFLEKNRSSSYLLSTAIKGAIIAGIPFFLILKQPDLGTALILFPVTLVMFYFGNIDQRIIKFMTISGSIGLIIVGLIFSGIISHESLRPYATLVLKEYQFDRLDPSTPHQKAAGIAIAMGGLFGSGWRRSEFTGGGWLPFPYTDSVFPAFGEEFGLMGLFFLLVLFYALIYFSFQVSAVAKDPFGRLLSAGVAVYLAMHILVNIGMMCGLLPITGVPLILVTYGGSSIVATMTALGILQSIYSRRFMF